MIRFLMDTGAAWFLAAGAAGAGFIAAATHGTTIGNVIAKLFGG